jgi:glutamate synthase (ferredoxin)
MMWIVVVAVALVVVAIYDLTQRQRAILRTFPIIGHVRYWLEAIGPELRQYIVTDNDEERPFSRDQRRWIYASAKRENNYFGFGSDNEMELQPNYLIIKHNTFPLPAYHPGDAEFDPQFRIPCAKTMGAARGRARAFRPASIVNVSGMSFGSLSGPAVEALNRGSQIAGCLQSTGEGGVSSHHLSGGDLVWQVGTGYFGCREPDGRFSLANFKNTIARAPQIRAIEIKLSQGAKPGVGGLLPKAKISREIAEIRGIPMDRDCISPAAHSAFRNADEMLDFVELIASETGLPVGIKSAVGDSAFWEDLARLMVGVTRRRLHYDRRWRRRHRCRSAGIHGSCRVAIQGGFQPRSENLHGARAASAHSLRRIGQIGFPEAAVFAFALGCDTINVGREAMMAIGCIQAQRCHTNHCPTGVATQHPWLVRGVDPTSKATRLANYIITLRKDVLALSRACGVPHPALITADQLELLDARFGASTIAELFGYGRGLGCRPQQTARKHGA